MNNSHDNLNTFIYDLKKLGLGRGKNESRLNDKTVFNIVFIVQMFS